MIKKPIEISASILSADFANLAQAVRASEAAVFPVFTLTAWMAILSRI